MKDVEKKAGVMEAKLKAKTDKTESMWKESTKIRKRTKKTP